jgi:hypothetical protein
MGTYNRSLEELKQHAVRFWSDELKQLATDVSVLPLLIESQEKFLSILTMADSSPELGRKRFRYQPYLGICS